MESRNLVQVSMNLTNYHETSLHEAFEAIQQQANKFGVEIEESELVGLAPRDALPSNPLSSLKMQSWSPEQVLETRLAQAGLLS